MSSLYALAQTQTQIAICLSQSPNENPQTIVINESEWSLYEAMGASIGACISTAWDNEEGIIPTELPEGEGNVITPVNYNPNPQCSEDEENKGYMCGEIADITRSLIDSLNPPQDYLVGTGKQIIPN